MLFRSAFILLFVAFSFEGNGQNKIHIVDFKIVESQNKININWATDNAGVTNYFELEKSDDGKNFKTIALILGPDPSKSNCDCYGCDDKDMGSKKEFFYRLKHISVNGEVEFSETKMLAINK